MRYFLERQNDTVTGWIVCNTKPNALNIIEVEPQEFKNEMNKLGIDYELETDKVEKLQQEKSMLEEALLEMAEIQSQEYENRAMLEEAIVELANLIGGV